MLQPPPLKSFPRYPVVTAVAVLAIGASVLWWLGAKLDGVEMNSRVWERWELWRALTSTLPHVNVVHLGFNLYWFWVFGTLLESVYGHVKFAGMIVLLAVVSSLLEFSFLYGGVGLSGVGYGLWGMLAVLSHRDSRFAGAVDPKTNQLFITWFFVCIFLTVTDLMPVGNIAHGSGAVAGALLGLAITRGGRARTAAIAGVGVLVAVGLLGSTIFWDKVNLSKNAEAELELVGIESMNKGDYPRAIKLLETAAHRRDGPARAWYNLGIAYQRQKHNADALAAYERAAQMPGADNEMRETAKHMREYMDFQRNH